MNPFINNTNITQIHVVASVSMLINASGTIIYHDQEYFNQFIHHGVICTIMVMRDHLSVISVVLKKCTNTWSSCTTNWSSKIIEFSGWDWSNTFLFWIINVSIWNACLITKVLHDIGEFKICVNQEFPRFGINWTDF
jgi:hypothetical protein